MSIYLFALLTSIFAGLSALTAPPVASGLAAIGHSLPVLLEDAVAIVGGFLIVRSAA
jgi:uncharacterized membrane protein